MTNPVRAVIFDLGNVLVGVDFPRLWERLSGVAEPGAGPERVTRDELMVRWCTGLVPPERFHREVCARAGVRMDYPGFVRWWCDVFRPMPEMEPLLREVAAAVPVGLLSDTDPLHWADQLAAHPHLGLVPRPTLSFRIGLMKPDPGCYRAASEDVGVPPWACLFVDDLERNVDGARAAGMQAVRFTGAADLRRHLVERSVLRG